MIKDPLTNHRIPNSLCCLSCWYYIDTVLNKESLQLLVNQAFPPLSKHFDGSRNAMEWWVGHRDFILARSAETYLIKKWSKNKTGKIRHGRYTDALPHINAVRTRAQYANGESRVFVLWWWQYNTVCITANTWWPSFILSRQFILWSPTIFPTTAASSSLGCYQYCCITAQDEYISSC